MRGSASARLGVVCPICPITYGGAADGEQQSGERSPELVRRQPFGQRIEWPDGVAVMVEEGLIRGSLRVGVGPLHSDAQMAELVSALSTLWLACPASSGAGFIRAAE